MNIAVEELIDTLYSSEDLAKVNPLRIPKHVAIIMDGNRRWAKQRMLPQMVGHWKGSEALTKIVKAASELGVEVLTVYAFSTENWRRSMGETHALMHLLRSYLQRQRDRMIEEGVRLNVIGDLERLSVDTREVINETIAATAGGNKIDLVLAISYGGRNEICRATKRVAEDALAGHISTDAINEELFASYLDTARWNDPQLLIRAGKENRISNFLLWQISYAEMVLSDVLWPDFGPRQLLDSILEYQQREHRLGT